MRIPAIDALTKLPTFSPARQVELAKISNRAFESARRTAKALGNK